MTWLQIGLYLLIFGFMTIAFARAGIRNAREYKIRRGQPKVLATESELKELAPQWPLHRGRRWPEPSSGNALGIETLAMYARLAGTRDRATTLAAEAILVVSGAALGWQLPSFLKALGEWFRTGEQFMRENPGTLTWDKQFQSFLVLMPAFGNILIASISIGGIALGIFLIHRGRLMRDAARAYSKAVELLRSDVPTPVPPTRSFWSLFR